MVDAVTTRPIPPPERGWWWDVFDPADIADLSYPDGWVPLFDPEDIAALIHPEVLPLIPRGDPLWERFVGAPDDDDGQP